MNGMRTFELKVGIFILIGIAILFLIVFSIGDIYIVKPGYRVKIWFNYASGIGPSAPIRFAGVSVGQVEGIHLFYDEKEKRTKAEINAWIKDQKMKIEKDARVTINTLGLLGEKYVEIFPGTPGSPVLQNNEVIVGHDPIPMEKITENLANLSDSVSQIVDKLKRGEGTIGQLLMNDSIYKNLEEFTGDIKKHPWKLLNKPRGED